ncbi:MAG: toprim domain-containing protein [Alphaproteobacteria bacterium]|nr:toprim domain-containing protein [Alphaproteobacteria bacterium]
MATKEEKDKTIDGKPVIQRRRHNIGTYGPSKLACGSDLHNCKWIILVEGTADVRSLSDTGYENTLALNGASVDPSIKKICRSKDKVVAFLDGDRSGELIMKTLKSMVQVDYELRADPDMEVEETPPPRIAEILDPIRDKIENTKNLGNYMKL